MVRIAILGFLAFGLVGCGGSKLAQAEKTAAASDFKTLACEVGYYEPEKEPLRTPTQPHLKQTSSLENGAALIRTPDYETGGGRLGYAAVRSADGKLAVIVECGNSAETQSFSAVSNEVTALVQCSDLPLPDFIFFANTEERAKNPDPDWESSPMVRSILVRCAVKN